MNDFLEDIIVKIVNIGMFALFAYFIFMFVKYL